MLVNYQEIQFFSATMWSFCSQLYIQLEQEKQQLYVDKHHKDVVFEREQIVFLKTTPSGMKSTRRHTGPYKIVNKLSFVNYDIQLVDGMRNDIVHVEKSKPYLSVIAELEQPHYADY